MKLKLKTNEFLSTDASIRKLPSGRIQINGPKKDTNFMLQFILAIAKEAGFEIKIENSYSDISVILLNPDHFSLIGKTDDEDLMLEFILAIAEEAGFEIEIEDRGSKYS